MADHAGGPPGAIRNGPYRGTRDADFRDDVQQDIAVADDNGQQVVEIVGDAAGHSADRLHLLGLPQLLFGSMQRLFRLPEP